MFVEIKNIYTKPLLLNKEFFRKREKEGEEIVRCLDLQHLSSQNVQYITHPLVEIQYEYMNDLVRMHYQAQRHVCSLFVSQCSLVHLIHI